MPEHKEEKIEGKIQYKGKVIDLALDTVRLENGRTATREVVIHHGGACVLAFNEKDEIALVRQFRYAAGRELLELPAGKLEAGENPLQAIEREIVEEIGYQALDMKPFGQIIPTCAYCTEIIYIHRAEQLLKAEQKLDADEFLDVLWLPFAKALEMVLAGEITDAKTCYAILKETALRGRE